MHGGAPGSGAPPGNRNAVTHGLTTADAIAERRAIRFLLEDACDVLEKLDGVPMPEADQHEAEPSSRGKTTSGTRDP